MTLALAGRHILLVGDSWIAGAAGRALAAALAAQGAVVMTNGVVGRTAIALANDAGFRAQLESADPAAPRPSDVLFVLGVNDTPGERTTSAYRELAERAAAAGVTAWSLSNATLEGSVYRTRVEQIEAAQRSAFGAHAIAGSTFASPGDFDTSRYHLTPDGAARWGVYAGGVLATYMDARLATKLGLGLIRSLPLAEGFFGRF